MLLNPFGLFVAGVILAIGVVDDLMVAFDGGESVIKDFFASFGAFNISGNTYSYASNDLTAKRTAGKTFSANSNYDANKMIPHILTTNEENPISIHYYYRDALGEWVNTEPYVNYIDPNYYDSGTGKQIVPDTKLTIQVLAFYVLLRLQLAYVRLLLHHNHH